MKQIIKTIIVLLLVSMIFAFVFVGCEVRKQDDVEVSTDITEKAAETESSEALMEIPTSYGVLEYPSRWINYLNIDTIGEPTERIDFYAQIDGKKDVHVLTVHFNEDGEFPLGVLEYSGESVYIAYSYGATDVLMALTQEEQYIVYAMQEGINNILSGLEKNPDFILEQ